MEICIADNLRLLRYKRGYSLEAVAEIISVSRQTVAKWESGDSLPDLSNCIKLSALYRLSLDELVNKPLTALMREDFIAEDGKVCGVIEMDSEGRVTVPESIREMFGFAPGGKILLFADKNQGVALVKCNLFGKE